MRKLLPIIILVSSILFFSLSTFGFAEEPSQPPVADQGQVAAEEEQAAPAPQNEEVTEFSYGTVKSLGEGQLVVSEYDYDNDKDIEITYSVPADANFDGVGTLSEIAAGDAVDIDYVIKDGQKVASMISVEKVLILNSASMNSCAPYNFSNSTRIGDSINAL